MVLSPNSGRYKTIGEGELIFKVPILVSVLEINDV